MQEIFSSECFDHYLYTDPIQQIQKIEGLSLAKKSIYGYLGAFDIIVHKLLNILPQFIVCCIVHVNTPVSIS